MVYEYEGYLRSILPAPDAAKREDLDAVVVSANDLIQWATKDLPSTREWEGVPVQRSRTESGVSLTGQFKDVRRIDTIAAGQPCFWVPLSSLGWSGASFPVDVERYPIVEITYRCTSDNAHPACTWTYPGGGQHLWLQPTKRWRTVAVRIPHLGFPKQVDAFVFRLYSTTRTTESFEIEALRFRAMSDAEKSACEADAARLEAQAAPHYPVLDEFLPLGVSMDAETSRRLSEMLGVSFGEYWALAMEDIVKHHQNCIALENVHRLSAAEWRELLSFADLYDIRIVATLQSFPLGDAAAMQHVIETRVKPYADSDVLVAWSLHFSPGEQDFQGMLDAQSLVREADPKHPVAVVVDSPGAYALYAPFFPATGIRHSSSHSPWDMRDLVRTHAPLARGQQFWVVGPAYVYGTGTPEWSSCPELRLMVNLAFANGARGWFSYSYHNDPIWTSGSAERTLTGPFLTFSDLWLELDNRMMLLNALAPLLLRARPVPLVRRWHMDVSQSDGTKQRPEDIAPASVYRMAGPDFHLYFLVSNDMRGMASINIDIPFDALRGEVAVDVTDFIVRRVWEPMALKRHLEMFPGQAHVVLVARPEVCEQWRDILAARLVEDDQRQLAFDLQLARAYDLDTSKEEAILRNAAGGNPLDALAKMDHARDMLENLIYSTPSISDPRSAIIKASSAVCACDGALCRLLARGDTDRARELGLQVIPLAREFTRLRLELRRGKGAGIGDHCRDVTERTVALLAEIRAETERG